MQEGNYSSDGKVHDKERLKELQALPLWRKIQITQARIIEWYNHFNGQVYISFSGGKDSTVLLHIARKIYPDIPVVFSNTGLEYPEIQSFANAAGAEFVYPKMRFTEVIKTYGYPIISKEVSEAIYYARRINPRERERKNGNASNFLENAHQEAERIIGKTYRHTHTFLKTIVVGRCFWGIWVALMANTNPIITRKNGYP